jgi:hypothetical protein
MKLNEAAVGSAVIIGTFVGLVTGSLLMFLLTTGGIIAAACYRNEIRLAPKQNPRQHKRRRRR